MNRFLVPRRAALVLAALLAAGCAAPPPPPPPPPSNQPVPFEQAVAAATDALAAQLQPSKGGNLLAQLQAKPARRTLVLDPSLDAGSGQQTAGTQQLDRLASERLAARAEQFEVLPFRAANLARAQLVLTGTLTRLNQAYRINLAATDLATGVVAAQASAVATEASVDMSPLPYYRDSPVLVKDKVIDGYVLTSATPVGQKGDATYLERIAAATVINDAMVSYNAERYEEALGQYRSALATPAGEQMRVLNGIYLSTSKLNRPAEAEAAFGRVVAFGIAARELGVKFLFNPNSTEFWSDPKISGPYTMWLRQIAREAGTAKVCMDVVGHTSKTGTEAYNDALSLRRATTIRQRLIGESAELGSRTRPQGMGFRQNLVGSGSDDAVDALDRRVEFKIVAC
ncbi:OmpA family protein [Piscinibacter defluvii]|uniref:OmpA family protein n=1 Tax=Piscinibacter defluvii TaxID=1796922 RepID=UPI000FDD8C5F|nr:OmpA family protein [Piscinibacter defluvii]